MMKLLRAVSEYATIRRVVLSGAPSELAVIIDGTIDSALLDARW